MSLETDFQADWDNDPVTDKTRIRGLIWDYARQWFQARKAQCPITVGQFTITDMTVDIPKRMVVLQGSGGAISWPIQIVNPRVLVRDAVGALIEQSKETTDPATGDPIRVVHRFRFDPDQIVRDLIVQLNQEALARL